MRGSIFDVCAEWVIFFGGTRVQSRYGWEAIPNTNLVGHSACLSRQGRRLAAPHVGGGGLKMTNMQ